MILVISHLRGSPQLFTKSKQYVLIPNAVLMTVWDPFWQSIHACHTIQNIQYIDGPFIPYSTVDQSYIKHCQRLYSARTEPGWLEFKSKVIIASTNRNNSLIYCWKGVVIFSVTWGALHINTCRFLRPSLPLEKREIRFVHKRVTKYYLNLLKQFNHILFASFSVTYENTYKNM